MQEVDYDKIWEYRQLLIQFIHVTAIKFLEFAANVVHALMEFLQDSNNSSALDVVQTVKSNQAKSSAESSRPWILSKYIKSVLDIQSTLQEIRKVLGEISILVSEQWLLDEAKGGKEPDGDASGKKDEKLKEGGGILRVFTDGMYALSLSLILGGDFFAGAILATELTKLKFNELSTVSTILCAEAMLIMTSIICIEQAKFIRVLINKHSHECVLNCIQTLSELEATPAAAYTKMLGPQEAKAAEWKNAETKKAVIVQVDNLPRKLADNAINYDEDIRGVIGSTEISEDFISNLSYILKLTGFSDPIYGEAYVKMHRFNVVLGELSEGDTRYDLTFLRKCSTCQPNYQHVPEPMLGLHDVGRFSTRRAT
ncbi:hypothetical protein PILCRDRAFT_14404 [Piloderma croceum F 1598]|uniref:Coatomer beta subunit C-terminal domain-containing protein n=1 Tax=Piloderma croceum (strain F 1598) TaxID=765440 RepID=A0A0C3AKR3_PILCF|nr:hypothetical protein PILCRDRAFT_14404 [Piloderma croceum F 1598]